MMISLLWLCSYESFMEVACHIRNSGSSRGVVTYDNDVDDESEGRHR